MKVLLVNPAKYYKEGNIWKSIDRCLPHLGLAYIAAVLEKNNHEIKILDLEAEQKSEPELKQFLQEFNPGIIGISSTTPMINSALKLAEFCKRVLPKTLIAFGGVHASIMPSELLKEKFVDVIVRGEGELTFLELANGKKISQIQGVSFKKNGKIMHNKDRAPIQNLDDLPMPAYHLLPMSKYMPSLGNFKRLPAISIITSRGCPGKCTFCHTKVFGEKIRFESARKVFEEIEYLVENFGIKEISIYDDTFTANRQRIKELCKMITDSKLALTWSCMSRVDVIDEETLRLMKKAGCHQIGYGIESADEKILENINKRISLEQAKKAVMLTQKAGIDARAMFMFGNPGESEESLEKTLNYAIELNPDLVIFNITTPFPGTEMFEWARKNGFLKTLDWDDYDLSKPVMELPTVSSERIIQYYKKAYKRFYFRPKFLLKRLLKIRSLEDLKMAFKSVFAVSNLNK